MIVLRPEKDICHLWMILPPSRSGATVSIMQHFRSSRTRTISQRIEDARSDCVPFRHTACDQSSCGMIDLYIVSRPWSGFGPLASYCSSMSMHCKAVSLAECCDHPSPFRSL